MSLGMGEMRKAKVLSTHQCDPSAGVRLLIEVAVY